MRVWRLFMGLLIIGLISPFWGSLAALVVPSFSDGVTQAVIWASLPILAVLWVVFNVYGE